MQTTSYILTLFVILVSCSCISFIYIYVYYQFLSRPVSHFLHYHLLRLK
jgi:hypothetical protein